MSGQRRHTGHTLAFARRTFVVAFYTPHIPDEIFSPASGGSVGVD